MTLQTTSIHGFVLLRLLASLRRWRPRSLRFAEEHLAMDAWLTAMQAALPRHAGFAQALAELPRLRKGYSDTFERGKANFDAIFEARVSQVKAPDDAAAKALRQAIAAALADPESKALAQELPAVAARPVFWKPREATNLPKRIPGS
jgi:indolepyruvate ferredoxin oxidoreductase beta subunit